MEQFWKKYSWRFSDIARYPWLQYYQSRNLEKTETKIYESQTSIITWARMLFNAPKSSLQHKFNRLGSQKLSCFTYFSLKTLIISPVCIIG